jgi:glucose/arabinose dehydrogenase
MKKLSFTVAILSSLALLASCGNTSPGDTAPVSTPAPSGSRDVSFATEQLATFAEPWAAAFAPGTQMLFVTEKAGTLKWFDMASKRSGTVSGAPAVDYGGQGGLGDIAFLPAEAAAGVGSRTLYLSWVEAGTGDTRGAVVGRGRLACSGAMACRIEAMQVIWRQSPKVAGRGHFSHRLAISPDGSYLFVTTGDRQMMDPAQDTSNNLGKIVRLNLDGAPAAGNAFTGQAGKAQDIWSLGHRNILGLKFDASGRLWGLEHGPAGGDELNLIKVGANYGWPVVSEGDHYDGKVIPPHSTRPEFAAPAISWNPVIAPGDFIFHSGKMFPDLRGQAIIGGMKPTVLVRVAIDGETARELQRLPMERRIREVVEAPDGAILLLEDGDAARLWRLTPG